MLQDGELYESNVTLTQVHMSQAIDLLCTSLNYAKDPKYRYDWVRSNYNALSSIIHSFSAVESVINATGHQVFFDDTSYLYVKNEDRNYVLKKVISSWKNTSCIDKLNIIVEQIANEPLPAKLFTEFLEFNNLRNWISHGFVFKSTLLLESNQDEENTFTLVDREDSVDWKKKFPNTKFNPLDNLTCEDAKKALIISLSVILFIHRFRKEPFALLSYFFSPYYKVVDDASVEAEALLETYLQEAADKA